MKWKNERNCALDCYQHSQIYQIQEVYDTAQINDIDFIFSLLDNYKTKDNIGGTGMDHMKKVPINSKTGNCHTKNSCRHSQQTHSVSLQLKKNLGIVIEKRDNYMPVKSDEKELAVTKQKSESLRKNQKNEEVDIEKIETENSCSKSTQKRQGCKQLSSIISLRKKAENTNRGENKNVNITSKNKELIEEIAKSFFEQNKLALLEGNGDGIDTSRTRQGGYLLQLISPTFAGDNLDLSNYFYRLITFCEWPVDAPVSAIRLAAAGFYYSKSGTRVECFSCGLSISDWSAPDNDPLKRHKENSPTCLFLNSKEQESATGGSENTLQFPTLNTKLNDVTKSNPEGNVHAQFNEAVEIENNNTKKLISSSSSSSSSNADVEEDNSEVLQNIVPNCTDTERIENASQRGLPIDQPVDNISTQEIENVNGSSPISAALNQDVSDYSVRQQEPERSDHLNEVDYSQLDYQNFAIAKHPQYTNPRRRLETFRSWSYHNEQHPQQLVEAGFYYTDSNDVVRCFHCDIGLAEWAVEDDPWVEHARHSPQCYYLREQRGMDFVDNVQRSWREIYTPKCPQFEDYHIRHSTYQGWPSDRTQSPRELAAAGFYYTGEVDTVRCHYCDGGLRQWEPGDNPWVEHARWFPFCKYVVKMKGLPFIEEVARTYNELYVDNIENQESSAETYGAYGMDDFGNGNDANIDALSMAASVSILDMGYSKTTVIRAINEYLVRTGNREFTAEDLLLVITETNEDEVPKDEDGTENSSSEIGLQDISRINAEQLNNEELRKVNTQIKSNVFLCKTCKKRDRNMIFIPCGHRETCEQCAEKTMICFTCGHFINKRVKTFLS